MKHPGLHAQGFKEMSGGSKRVGCNSQTEALNRRKPKQPSPAITEMLANTTLAGSGITVASMRPAFFAVKLRVPGTAGTKPLSEIESVPTTKAGDATPSWARIAGPSVVKVTLVAR